MKEIILRITMFIIILMSSVNIGSSKDSALPDLPATNELLITLYKNKTNNLTVAACNKFLETAAENKSTSMIEIILNPPPKERLMIGKPENLKPDQSGINSAFQAFINRMLLNAKTEPETKTEDEAYKQFLFIEVPDITDNLVVIEKLLNNDVINPDQETINSLFKEVVSRINVLSIDMDTFSGSKQSIKAERVVDYKSKLRKNLFEIVLKILESPTKPSTENIDQAFMEALDSNDMDITNRMLTVSIDNISGELLAKTCLIFTQKHFRELRDLVKNKLIETDGGKNKLESALTSRINDINDELKWRDKKDPDDKKQIKRIKNEKSELEEERRILTSIN